MSNTPEKPNRYRTAAGGEGEHEPGSRDQVLRNKLGITSLRELERAETVALFDAQERYVSEITAETVFSANLICQMHRDWLGGIYEWAGTYRTVEMEKSGFRWPPARLVRQNMAAIERETLRVCTPCRPAEVSVVAEQIARVQADVLMVHPFREGNGRLARWVSDLMAMQAGYPAPEYGFTGKRKQQQRATYLAAVIRGYRTDYLPLTRFVAEAIGRALARRR